MPTPWMADETIKSFGHTISMSECENKRVEQLLIFSRMACTTRKSNKEEKTMFVSATGLG